MRQATGEPIKMDIYERIKYKAQHTLPLNAEERIWCEDRLIDNYCGYITKIADETLLNEIMDAGLII